jgi:hypothetical protein
VPARCRSNGRSLPRPQLEGVVARHSKNKPPKVAQGHNQPVSNCNKILGRCVVPRSPLAHTRRLEQREIFELGLERVPENISLRSSVPSRNSTELERKMACQRTQPPEGTSPGPELLAKTMATQVLLSRAEGAGESRPFERWRTTNDDDEYYVNAIAL